jgi:hypothetical protein
MDTQFVREPVEGGADRFLGCDVFSKPMEANVISQETLLMDDTSCTNCYGLPLPVVLAIDEKLISQLVAFAFLRDRTTESFSHFLTWMRDHVVNREIDPGHPVPRAIVVDRHDGQYAAIQGVFPRFRVIFCAEHLATNIQRALGCHSLVDHLYWRMMQGNCSEHQYLAALRFAREDYQEETKQSDMIDFLEKTLDHYLPSRVRPFSPKQVSARVAGFFGRYNTLTDHEVLPLLTIAKGIRLLAHAAIVGGLWDIGILLPIEEMSKDDRREIGSFARDILIAEIEVANQTVVTSSLTGDLLCSCGARVKDRLPCSHYLNTRPDRRPMLSVEDIPPRWRRQHISQDSVASHTVTRMPSDRRLRNDQYCFANLSARFAPYLSDGTRTQDYKNVLTTA